ncbi:hypothetical protein BV898_04579 [Hypsibius exemplaris]|uniref:ZP domain-containing protein n=1 Tax=Hypsibius exemplaris TaxID=2072580 RepID=A0A1W0X1V8_HYPEX|nr:hypothetical protein BV898_04579 [Hypsibius exemplaris]
MTSNKMGILFYGLFAVCGVQVALTVEPEALLGPVVARGVMRIEDPPVAHHLISANSVQLPSNLIWKERSKRDAVVEADVDSNGLGAGPTPDSPLPKLTSIQADCVNPQFIKVSVEFDRPFDGIIYTKGHFTDETCTYAKEGSSLRNQNFTISTDACGSLDNNHAEAANSSITEATVIIQNDPLFQDANDVARRIRCSWSDRFDKIISSHGFKVGSLNENTMDYSADAVSVWMDLRMGKDPFQGTPVTNGVVRLGSDMTIVVYIKSKIDKGLDVVIRDCVANDAKRHQQIQLTDENGCVVQKKLMTPFIITDRVGQSGASRIAYAMLKSFKFPDSLDVNIICNVAMCKGPCGISCSAEGTAKATGAVAKTAAGKVAPPPAVRQVDSSRPKRDVPAGTGTHEAAPMDDALLGKTVFLKEKETTEVILERGIRVLSDNDITEVLVGNQNNRTFDVMATMVKNTDYICVPKTGFGIGLAILLLIILILTIATVFLCCAACARRGKKAKVIETSTINLYNSTEQLNSRSKDSPVSFPISGQQSTSSLPRDLTTATARGSAFSMSRVSQQADFKASAITLPGVGIHTNPHVRQSTMSLNAMHLFPKEASFPPFVPFVLPSPAQGFASTSNDNDQDNTTEKARSLRSMMRHPSERPHSIAMAAEEPDESARSLRSFTLRSDAFSAAPNHHQPSDLMMMNGNEENPRSLRSFHVRSDQRRSTLTGLQQADNNDTSHRSENPRSLRSITVRSNSNVGSVCASESEENPRSEGTLRSDSPSSGVLGQPDNASDENPRSMRSVSVYRN